MTNLRDLPPELKIAVARVLMEDDIHGHKQADIKIAALAALSVTDRFFHHVADPLLYQFGVLRHPYLLCWATEIGNLNLMKKILKAGSVDPQVGIIRYRPEHEYTPWDPKTMSAGERFRRFYRRDGLQFQQREDFFAQFVEDDPMEEYGPFSDDSSFTEEDTSEHDGFFLDVYDDSDDMDDSSSEQFSEDASVADHYSADEASDGTEEPNGHASLDGVGGNGISAGDDSDDEDSTNGDDAGMDDEAMFEEFEEVEREMIGIIRYPDEDDYDEVDEHDIKGLYWFPVHIAARYGNLPALELLADSGALLNISSKGFCCSNHPMALYWEGWNETHPAWTPLHVALCHGHTELVKYMLKECPHIQERLISYDEPSWSVLPVFISAMRHGYPKLAEFSLEQGVDDATDGDPDLSGATLLWRAFWETDRFPEALALLLRYRADIDHDLGQGHTLLVEACLHGNFEEAIALVNAGANVTIVLNNPGPATRLDYAWDNIGQSFPGPIEGCGVLDICCGLPPILTPGPTTSSPQRPTSLEFAPHLIRHLFDSDARHTTKRSPLHIAASAHNSMALEVLLNLGMDPTSLDEENYSVLVRASTAEGSFAPLEEFSRTISILAKHLGNRRGKDISAGIVANPRAGKLTTADGEIALRSIMEDEILAAYPRTRLARHAAAFKLITEGLADINTRDKFNRTTLMLTVAEGDVSLAHQLVKYGAKIERRSEIDDLAAMWAGFIMNDDEHDEKKIYGFLSQIDLEKRILRDPQFLAFAMYELRTDVVDLMVSSIQPDTLMLTDEDAWRKLGDKQATISASQKEVVGLMLEDETVQKPLRDGWTLLHIAVEFGCPNVVKKLLNSLGADVNQPNPDGQSPLHIVIKSQSVGNDTMIRLLCKYGADPHRSASKTTKSPIDYAIQQCYCWMVPKLLREHPIRGNPRAQSNLYLHSIVSTQIKGNPTVARVALLPLIRAGADVNATDSNGDTPLSFLLKEILRLKEECDISGFSTLVTVVTVPSLIRNGASPSVRNNEGKTVLDLMNEVKNHKDGLFGLRDFLRSTLLYNVMLYRNRIGL
ncbi:tnni3 interacting kinase [Colletotrichum incanum]|uniref:Tnni3 interacting kinase n=1 Tax=Colletotrichum incanum TaxID=1573173 RepID=A0A161VZI0_COLIC|nr:tnni3 interacting kinase [Colletotrichum incanum]